jgi:GH43 family beta-xylosidase
MPLTNRPGVAVFRNPLVDGTGPDPWMVWHDGFYYLTYTRGRDLAVRRAAHIGELRAAADQVVWRDHDSTRNRQIYAGEFHLVDGPNGTRWYFYYCADDGNDRHHRVYLLEADAVGGTPIGPYHFKGKLRTDPDDKEYALDPDVFVLPDGRQYLLWAGDPGHRLFIQRLQDPWTTTGYRQLLEASGFGCPDIREGPCTLVRNGRVFLIYSACDTGNADYKLGMLIADVSADLVDPRVWRQHPAPLLQRSDRHGVYGPGHNGFFRSPDGTEDWIVYAAKTTAEFTYAHRTPRAQRVTWSAEGLPVVGEALALEADIAVPSGDLT